MFADYKVTQKSPTNDAGLDKGGQENLAPSFGRDWRRRHLSDSAPFCSSDHHFRLTLNL